jgi:hypothetical protein
VLVLLLQLELELELMLLRLELSIINIKFTQIKPIQIAPVIEIAPGGFNCCAGIPPVTIPIPIAPPLNIPVAPIAPAEFTNGIVPPGTIGVLKLFIGINAPLTI